MATHSTQSKQSLQTTFCNKNSNTLRFWAGSLQLWQTHGTLRNHPTKALKLFLELFQGIRAADLPPNRFSPHFYYHREAATSQLQIPQISTHVSLMSSQSSSCRVTADNTKTAVRGLSRLAPRSGHGCCDSGRSEQQQRHSPWGTPERLIVLVLACLQSLVRASEKLNAFSTFFYTQLRHKLGVPAVLRST